MSETDESQIVVKTGVTVHQMSKISSHETSIKINMEVYFTYDEEEIINLFFQPKTDNQYEQNKEKDDFQQNFQFPFLIANANEIDFYKYWSSYKYFDSTMENVFKDCSQDHRLDNKPRPKRTKQQEDTDYHQMVGIEKHDSFRRFKMEKYMIICELEVYNFTEKIPFNEVYIPIKIITNGGPHTNKIQFRFEQESNINWEWSVNTLDQGLWLNFLKSCGSRCTQEFDCISTRVVKLKEGNPVYEKEYDRVYFLRIYRFNFWEDIVKYYLIPSLLTITIILFYDIDKSDFSGLFSTIILGDIALLFIQPETNNLTYNEHSVHLNIGLVLILTLLKITKTHIHTLIYSLGGLLISVGNFSHNYISSYYFFKNKRNTISTDGREMAEFDQKIYGNSISGINDDSQFSKKSPNLPKKINTSFTVSIQQK